MVDGIRAIVASEDLGAVIDRGAKIVQDIKSLEKEDKKVKEKITSEMAGKFEGDEITIRVSGSSSDAVITASESMSIQASSEQYPELKKSIEDGFLAEVVEQKKILVVPDADIAKAASILKEAGIQASISYSVSVKAVDVREMRKLTASPGKENDARNALEACLASKVTHRVKYEKKKGELE